MSSSGYVFEIKPKRAWIEVVDDHYDDDGNLEDYKVFLHHHDPVNAPWHNIRKVELADWLLTEDEIEELEVQNRESNLHGNI